MPDIQTLTSKLKIDTYFVDGDTRVINLTNPSPTLQSSQIQELNTWLQTNQLMIGDKNGAAFGKISKVTRTDETRVQLDI